FHPDYLVERTINPDWETLAVARQQGVLTALVRPAGSGLGGQAALIHTEGYTFEDLAVQGGIAVAVSLAGGRFGGGDGHQHDDGDADAYVCCSELMSGMVVQDNPRVQGQGEQEAGGRFDGVTRRLRETREYLDKRAKATPDKPEAFDARYEALTKSLSGDLPFMISANTASDIREAVAWAQSEKVRVLLYGCSGAGEMIEWLARKEVPIVLSAVFGMPEADRPTDFFYSLPSRLAKAGVKFALSTNDAHNVRQLRDQAGFAAAFGMDREDAVRAITLWPAEILGVSHRIGAIKPGMEGTLILTDGDLLETKSRVLRAWIAGREVELTNKQTRLFEKYNGRPKPKG
ncbi:MAG TPA: amidohydrolase family protein, partial [Fimbriimonadaceae bacterium]|nr:amidohydrolase family protein [Fimbriimonadaceae bacterium]